MSVVLLDAGPVGFLTNPNNSPIPVAIRQWLSDMIAVGRRVILPEITDYEVRRELLRAGRVNSRLRLDSLAGVVEYVPITTPVMQKAAELWAQARNAGRPTAHDHALDGDVILAAQALSLGVPVIITTANPAHLSRFVPTDDWRNIVP